MVGNEPVVEIRNVSKTMGKKKVVSDLNLEIYPGEVFGLLGPNGAGKTTTIRMLVGLISMTKGQVLISGHDVKKDFERAISQVGAIVENPELYNYLTGYQNLIHFSRMAGNISEKRIQEMIGWVGLEKTIHAKVSTYSLGMRQRLGLAQALLHSPSVLILDEPTNGLDPAGIREFRHHLKNVSQEEGMAVLVSSHLLAEMELMCDRIGIIQHGKLIDVQAVHDFIETEGREIVTFMVDPVHLAERLVRASFPEQLRKADDQSLEIHLDHEQIPLVTKCLVDNGVNIYGVKTASKTLEDQFIAMTGGQQIV